MISTEPFTVDNEMLTPKMSVKRHVVVKRYHDEIEKAYAEALAQKKERRLEGTYEHGHDMAPVTA